MLVSERRVEEAAASADPRLNLVARRVLDDPATQRRWEREHSRYMRMVAGSRRFEQQRAALRELGFGLMHRKALFEHLRDRAVRGDERRRVVVLFHGSRTYSEALITEHQLFIRSAASHLCTTYIGECVLRDPAFDEPFGEYERRYRDYFRLFCQVHASLTDRWDIESTLLPHLKLRVAEQRAAILALDGARPFAVVRFERRATPRLADADRCKSPEAPVPVRSSSRFAASA